MEDNNIPYEDENEIIVIPTSLGGKLIDIKLEKIIPDISIMKQYRQIRVS